MTKIRLFEEQVDGLYRSATYPASPPSGSGGVQAVGFGRVGERSPARRDVLALAAFQAASAQSGTCS